MYEFLAMAPLLTTEMAEFKQATINLRQTDGTDDGIKTLPELIDFNATHNPHHLFCLQPARSADGTQSDPPLAIDYLQFRNAIFQCSERLREEISDLKSPEKDSDGKYVKYGPVALFMESGLGVLIHLFALMSLGVPVGSCENRTESR